jgi:hypothetical protein
MRINENVIIISIFLFAVDSFAVDATRSITEIKQNGPWQVVEFSLPRNMFYRISSESINSNRSFLTFDFKHLNDCIPDPAVIITKYSAYNEIFDNGFLQISYKLPRMKEGSEVVKTHMSPGDDFSFFQFSSLRAETLMKLNDKGKMAVWIPGSANGVVKRSDNIYFSLTGFSKSFIEASTLCNDQR